jgi:hypothetical protein
MTPFYLQKLALTSPASGSRSVGIVRSWTKATELLLLLLLLVVVVVVVVVTNVILAIITNENVQYLQQTSKNMNT